MDSDDEDFVFFGTPIEREEEISSRKKKAVAEASGHLRALPSWKQEVRDEEGRRRFHGAFTGGFSAGYYNTVGSKEGWTPQSFTSSRKNRAEVKQQSILNFLDDDEKEELQGHSLGTSMQFDTFGFTAAEVARKKAEKEQQQRPSAIPGPVPDELVLPATDSIGVKLLLKMGWRHGHSIRDSRPSSLYDTRREARKAFLAFSSDDAASELAKGSPDNVMELPTVDDDRFSQSTPVYVINPKRDQHGLGYDPFKHAPEFREKKRSHVVGQRELGQRKKFSIKDDLIASKSGRVAPGFGIGALEDLDAEDEDVYASAGYNFEETYVQEIEEPPTLRVDSKKKIGGKEVQDVLPGFKIASNSDFKLARYDPPIIPKDFIPHHKFLGPLEINCRISDDPPPEIAPPDDDNLRVLIEGVATLVARCGKLFEDLSREKNQSNPLFSFLNGGNGHDYYSRKLWEERQKRNDRNKRHLDDKMFASGQKMTAESRGKILGEKPLERSSGDASSSVTSSDMIQLQFNLSDTFTKPASVSEFSEAAKPFLDDPAKQERFEQFLKEKYHGGLRSKDSSGASSMSEAARARERLEFEATADAIAKGKWGKASELTEISAAAGLQFTSGCLEQPKVSEAEELILKKMFPKREEYQWRPSPILCKRFDIIDPYMGKPPPAPRVRSKMDSLIFTSDFIKSAKAEENGAGNGELLSATEFGNEMISKEANSRETEAEVEAENVERPVDLYKAIFSDDSDEEEENSSFNQVEDAEKEDAQKKIRAANTTLSRLIAGDFLESLGKELGMEVPPDVSFSESKVRPPTVLKEYDNAKSADVGTLLGEPSSTTSAVSRTLINQEALQGKQSHQEMPIDGGSHKPEFINGKLSIIDGNLAGIGSSVKNFGKVELKKVTDDDKKDKTPLGQHQHQHWSSSSSEDERSRKRPRHHRHRSYSDTTDSSGDYRHRHHSRSKSRKKRSSGEKSSGRKYSKRLKHRSGYSPSRSSHHHAGKEHAETKREKRR